MTGCTSRKVNLIVTWYNTATFREAAESRFLARNVCANGRWRDHDDDP